MQFRTGSISTTWCTKADSPGCGSSFASDWKAIERTRRKTWRVMEEVPGNGRAFSAGACASSFGGCGYCRLSRTVGGALFIPADFLGEAVRCNPKGLRMFVRSSKLPTGKCCRGVGARVLAPEGLTRSAQNARLHLEFDQMNRTTSLPPREIPSTPAVRRRARKKQFPVNDVLRADTMRMLTNVVKDAKIPRQWCE